jgi:hypothetical protein
MNYSSELLVYLLFMRGLMREKAVRGKQEKGRWGVTLSAANQIYQTEAKPLP